MTSLTTILEETPSLSISKYTLALIKIWQAEKSKRSGSDNKISVSQTVSFLAFLYEKIRNAVEFREDHLVRRAAIERIVKRLLILNDNGRAIAEQLIRELLWARYYENNTVGEEKIAETQAIIDKYLFLRNELIRGRQSNLQERIITFLMQVLSCEIEEHLSPNGKMEAFTNFVYQMVRSLDLRIPLIDQEDYDIQIYIAVERAFSHSDNPILRYRLLKLMLPSINSVSWKGADTLLPKLPPIIAKIEQDIHHPLGHSIKNRVRKHMPAYLILRDIFERNEKDIKTILSNEETLKNKVDEMCRLRYDESKSRLRRTAIRSFFYILFTKVVFAMLVEIPYDLYIYERIAYIPVGINVLFPPVLMAFIVSSVSVPGDDNTKRIFQHIKSIVATDPDSEPHYKRFAKAPKTRSVLFSSLFSLLYFFMYVVSFGSIVYLLTLLSFNPVSQAVFLFFVTLVTFFAFRVIQITHEYQIVARDGLFSTIVDFFFLPIINVGHWLSGEVLTRFNFIILILDFLIEVPFKAIAEVIDEWVHFVKVKKEEIV